MVNKEILTKLAQTKSIAEISEIINVPYSTVWYNLRKYKIDAHRESKNRYTLFDTYTPESCYWAGFIAADGNVLVGKREYRTAIKLQKSDFEQLEKFKKAVGCESKIGYSNNSVHIQICSKQMFYALYNNFNIVPNKSLILEPPPITMPDNLVSHYIRGYFDGDGHIGYINGTYCNFNITCASLKVLEWIVNKLKIVNLINNYPIYKKNGKCYRIDVNSQKALNIFDWLYNDSNNTIRLDRKYITYMQTKLCIDSLKCQYRKENKRIPPGCKGFDLDYQTIGDEYLNGKKLKELAIKYQISQWALLDNFKKLGISKIKRKLETTGGIS